MVEPTDAIIYKICRIFANSKGGEPDGDHFVISPPTKALNVIELSFF